MESGMDLALNLAAFAFFVGLAFYVASLGVMYTRRTALADATAQIEHEYLRE